MNTAAMPYTGPERRLNTGLGLTLEPVDPTVVGAHAPPMADGAAALVSTVHRPIAEVMEPKLWTVHDEDSVARVEEIFAEQHLSCAPVMGANGIIAGMIGAAELAQFHFENKNPKAVQAWEICRIKHFEVSPHETVEDVARQLTEHQVESVAVTEDGHLLGVVTLKDLMQEILRVLPADTPA
ncbi:CBS domain-containing protein [Massilia sp. PAMC28688]|uniref:CBS domain-containing protein n=1 Tax=Massilia sp. PAMC28688 TaxID=2861283 RepID=UPI001C62F938|nr:CBS domain-containing protein [Massilia sp. PAMC28688]QYF92719.1 CBS domain-containing protein [Massilia sp. PAMC28688]